MNNFEWIKEYSDIDSLGHYLCSLFEAYLEECDKCPVSSMCSPGKNGFVEWLKKKYDEEKSMNINDLKIGDVLWQLRGIEQNGVYEFKVIPKSIEVIDDHKILFSDGSGGSINLLGKQWFFTRQEALDDFNEKYEKALSNSTVSQALTYEPIVHKERTDYQDYEVCKFNSVDTTTVYSGGITNLTNITNLLDWNAEYCEPLDMNLETLTLSEIWEQAKKISFMSIITVFIESPLEGTIFQCGNHEEGKWEKYGTTQGYA